MSNDIAELTWPGRNDADKARQPGHYWVRFLVSYEVWEIAHWEQQGFWFAIGDEEAYATSDLLEIDERRIARLSEPDFGMVESSFSMVGP